MARPAKRDLDILQPSDYEILELGAKNANYISDYYLRSPTSGTKWVKKPFPPDARKELGWINLHEAWENEGRPDKEWDYKDITYQIQKDSDGNPVFWQHHGWLFLDWQLDIHHCPQPEVTCIAGFGSGKTAFEAASAVVLAMSIPNARIFCIAPQMMQGMEVYKYIITNFSNTPFWDRFVWNFPQKPVPKFVIRNDYIGESSIEILSIEHDPEKIRTLEGDMVYLDQAEKIDELDSLLRDAGSRLRGMVQGRQRLGKFVMFANAGDNDELWYRYNMSEYEPETYKSVTVKTWDNPYLSERDIKDLKRRVGGSQEDIDQWLGAERPLGTGEHFPAYMVRDCNDKALDNIMNDAMERIAKTRDREEELTRKGIPFVSHIHDLPGNNFKKREAPKVGIYHWELPPDHDGKRQYVVVGDPGQSNPPDRNSPPIMVWDVTNFPKEPAVLRAFHWVYANGSYWPFLLEYERYVKEYHAQGRNAFDSTGMQKGFDELVFAIMNLMPEGLNMAGNNKFFALNTLKMFLGKRLMVYPYISHLFNQLTSYKLPDTKIKQDLVMCMAMSAMFIRRYFWLDHENDTDEEAKYLGRGEYDFDRWKRPKMERYKREKTR